HAVLGPHLLPADEGPYAVVRVLRPLADEVVVLTGDPDGPGVTEHPTVHEAAGVWSVVVPAPVDDDGTRHAPDYRVRSRYGDETTTADDPYRFLPSLGEMDLHLIGEGRHETLWQVLGANLRTYPAADGDITGTSFAVWAPNARGVRLVGDHNRWSSVHPLRSPGSSGGRELFVPAVGAGTRYKYEICGPD